MTNYKQLNRADSVGPTDCVACESKNIRSAAYVLRSFMVAECDNKKKGGRRGTRCQGQGSMKGISASWPRRSVSMQ